MEAAVGAAAENETRLNKATVDSQVEGNALQQKLEGACISQRAVLDRGDEETRLCHAADQTDECFNA